MAPAAGLVLNSRPGTLPALQMGRGGSNTDSPGSKRKRDDDADKVRYEQRQQQQQEQQEQPNNPATTNNTSSSPVAITKKQHTGPSTSRIPGTLPSEPHETILAELRPRYDVLPLSVISSSKIEQRVARMLAHLGRFHPADLTVHPGVVLLHARAREVAKMVAVAEIVKRRVHEAGQKWYQYNRVYDVEGPAEERKERNKGPKGRAGKLHSVIEETTFAAAAAIAADSGAKGDDERSEEEGERVEDEEEDDFEAMPERFQRAIAKPDSGGKNGAAAAAAADGTTTTNPYMSIFLSRVPIPELQAKIYITAQSNEALIEHQQKKRMGLI